MRKVGYSKLVAPALAALATLAITSEARAQGAGEWGWHNGNTLRAGSLMAYGEAGWPGISGGVQYGLSDRIDIGGRFSFLYGAGYAPGIALGMELSAPIRISLLRGPRFSLLFHVDPGLKFLSFSGPLFGIQAPFGAEFGIHLFPGGTLSIGLDVPFYLNLTNGVFAFVPPMAGPGFEYHINENMAVGGITRFGAVVVAAGGGFGGGFGNDNFGFFGGGGGAFATFGFQTTAYFAYKIR